MAELPENAHMVDPCNYPKCSAIFNRKEAYNGNAMLKGCYFEGVAATQRGAWPLGSPWYATDY